MNLFRSEEHARNWARWDPEFEDNLKPLSHYLQRFSMDRHKARAQPDFISWMAAQQS